MRRFLLLVAAAAVAAPWMAAAGTLEVRLREPVEGQVAMGAVDVVVDVLSSAAVAGVEILLDGRRVALLEQQPYRLRVELGTDNVGHRIAAVATDVSGQRATAEVRTAAIPDSGQFDMSLQQLYVTVTQADERVLDLGEDAFRVDDNGERQQLVTFARGDIPFTAVLLIDSSSSMHGERLAAAAAGVREFVGGADELDRISVLAFSDQVLGRSDFDNDPELAEEVLAKIAARGGTAIHDHLYVALKLLEQRQGRRVAVLLSDGIDSHSALQMDVVMRLARRSQTMLYWIWLAQENSAEFAGGQLRQVYSTWRNSDEYREQFEQLRQTVEESGGRIIPVARLDEIEPVFVDILRELREQYVLGYYPSNEKNDMRWHRVDVKVRGAGLKVRTHEGYVDF